jgi:hypothetical protein
MAAAATRLTHDFSELPGAIACLADIEMLT